MPQSISAVFMKKALSRGAVCWERNTLNGSAAFSMSSVERSSCAGAAVTAPACPCPAVAGAVAVAAFLAFCVSAIMPHDSLATGAMM